MKVKVYIVHLIRENNNDNAWKTRNVTYTNKDNAIDHYIEARDSGLYERVYVTEEVR